MIKESVQTCESTSTQCRMWTFYGRSFACRKQRMRACTNDLKSWYASWRRPKGSRSPPRCS